MNVEKSLEKAGVDTKKYPSLAMQNILGYQGKAFAENSHWYKKIMKDGHVFNPYVHRRWLPYQFMNNIYWKRRWNGGVHVGYVDFVRDYIADCENFDRYPSIYEKLEKEANALYTLYKKDKKAYMERKAAFDYGDVFFKGILPADVKEGEIDDKNFSRIKDKLESEKSRCRWYWGRQITMLHLDRGFRNDIGNALACSGIYFTLKHLLMFDYENLHTTSSQRDELKTIRKQLIEGEFDFEIAFEIIENYVAEHYAPRY